MANALWLETVTQEDKGAQRGSIPRHRARGEMRVRITERLELRIKVVLLIQPFKQGWNCFSEKLIVMSLGVFSPLYLFCMMPQALNDLRVNLMQNHLFCSMNS